MLHDKTYEKVPVYKNYTDKKYTSAVHKATLIAFICAFLVFTVAQGLFPSLFNLSKTQEVRAGANSVQFTTNGDFAKSKAGICGATTASQVAISGAAYTDGTCAALATDASVTLPSSTVQSIDNTVVTVGTNPKGAAVNATTNKIYVANGGSSNVSVIDGTNNTVSATIAVGAAPYGVAVNAATNKIYVTNANSSTVSVIDGTTNTVTATVAVPSGPGGVAVNAVTNKIYVADYFNNNKVSVIDGTNNTITATITVGNNPNGVAVNAATNKIYVTNLNSSNVSVIDGTNNTVTATVTVGSAPYSVAVNATTNKIYVPSYTPNNVSVIDGTNNTVSATVSVGTGPIAVDVNATTNKIYVANATSNNFSVIDGTNNIVSATIAVNSAPYGVGVNATTNKVYIPNNSSNNVSVIDGTNNTISATTSVGTGPRYEAVNATTNKIYVANYNTNNVSVIDGTNNTVSATVSVGTGPIAVDVNATTNKIYVANYSSGNVSVIDGSNNTVSATVLVGTGPMAVNINATTNKIYVANYGSGNVSVIDGSNNTVSATVAVGINPQGIAVNATTNKIYVPNYNSGNVSVIDGTNNTVSATVAVGTSPRTVAVNATTNKIYVTNTFSNNVSVIDGTNNTVSATVTVGTNPNGVAVNATTNKIYVANGGSANVSVIDGTNNTVPVTIAGASPFGIAVNATTNKIYVTNVSSNNISVINIYQTVYQSPGTISGLKINATSDVKWGTLSWGETGGASALSSTSYLRFRTRGATTSAGLSSAIWSSYLDFQSGTSGSNTITTTHSQYLEVELSLISSDGLASPSLDQFTVSYDSLEAPTNGNITMYRADGVSRIKNNSGNEVAGGAGGGYTNEQSLILKVTDLTCGTVGGGNRCGYVSNGRKPEVEIKPVGTPFATSPVSGVDTTVGTSNNVGVDQELESGSVTIPTSSMTTIGAPGYHIRVRSTDESGRTSGWALYAADALAITIEQTAPTGTLSINAGATYATSTTSTLTNSATDTGGSGLSSMQFSNDASTWSGFETYNATKASWTLASGDGTKSVYAQFKDNAGNVSGKIFTSQADWQVGTLSGLDATSVSGDIKSSLLEQGAVKSSGTTTNLNQVVFSSSNVGYAFGSTTALKTTDGGSTWSSLPSLPAAIREAGAWGDKGAQVSFPSDNVGYFATDATATVYKTVNGGTSWSAVASTGAAIVNTVKFISDTKGFVNGYMSANGNGVLFMTTNGGTSWSTVYTAPAYVPGPNIIQNIDGTTLYGTGSTDSYKSVDGGSSWSRGTNAINSGYGGAYSFSCVSAGECYALGQGSIIQGYPPFIAKTTNGVNYSNTANPGVGNSILFTAANIGYVAGPSGLLSKTINGGSSWSTLTSNTSNSLKSFAFFGTNIITVGDGGVIRKIVNSFVSPATLGETGTPLSMDAGVGNIQNWTALGWVADTLASGQSIKFQVSTDGTNWKGPDGNPGSWTNNFFGQVYGGSAVTSIPSSLVASRYLYVKLQLSSDGTNTPVLHDLTIQSAASDSITLDTAPPSAATLLTPVTDTWQGSATPTLTWIPSASSDVVKQELYVDSVLSRTFNDKTTASTTPAVALSEGSHSWYIKSYDGAGNTTNSSTFVVKYDASAPVAPSSFNIVSATDSLALTWDFSNNTGSPIDLIKVERIDYYSYDPGNPTESWTARGTYKSKTYTGDSTGVTYTTDTPEHPVIDPSVVIEQGKKYAYRVTAKDTINGGYGTFSSVQSGLTEDSIFSGTLQNITVTPCINTPQTCSTNPSVRHKGYEEKITWSEASDNGVGMSHYLVYRSTTDFNASSFQDPDVRSSYQIVGVLPYQMGQSTVWYDNDQNNDATTSFVDGSGNPITISAEIQALTSKTTATTQLDDYVKYYYRIVGVDLGGNKSPLFNESPTTNDYDVLKTYQNGNQGTDAERTPDVTAPTVPTEVNPTATGIDDLNSLPDPTQGMLISWHFATDNSARSVSYKLYRAQGNASGPTEAYSEVTLPDPTVTAYQDKGLPESTWYYYKTKAYDPDSNTSAFSDESGKQTKNSQVPTTPQYVTVTTTKGNPGTNANVGSEVTVQFNGSAIRYSANKITGYEVYRATTNYNTEEQWLTNATKVKTYSNINFSGYEDTITYDATRTYVDTVTTDATDYFYRVRAIGTNSDGAAVSSLSSIQTGTLHYGWDTTPDTTGPAGPVGGLEVGVKDTHPNEFEIRNIVSWKMLTNADLPLRSGVPDFARYEVHRETIAGDGSVASDTNVASVTDLGDNYYVDVIDIVFKDTTFKYYVVIVDDAGTAFKYPNGSVINPGYSNSSTKQYWADSITPSKTTPVLAGTVTISDISVASATIEWNTDQETDGVVEFREKYLRDGNGAITGNLNTTGVYQVIGANSSPTENNTTQSHTVSLFGLKPNTTYDYRVVSKNYLGNTLRVAAPTVPALVTTGFNITPAAISTTTSTAEINWTTNLDASSAFVEYQLQKQVGDEAQSGTAGVSAESLSSNPRTHKVIVKGLRSNRTYTYKIKSISKDGFLAEYPSGSFSNFKTRNFDSAQFSLAPASSNVADKNITSTTAQIVWQTASPTTSWVDYGTKSGVYGISSGNDDMVTTHIVTLEGLVPGTKYFYHVRVKDGNEVEFTSMEYSFTAVIKPKISNLHVTNVTPYTATIAWDTNVDTETVLNWGKTTAYGEKKGTAGKSQVHQVAIENLEDNQEYHYQIVAHDEVGNEVVGTDELIRTPLDTEGPKILNVKTDIMPLGDSDTLSQVIVSWTTNKPSTTKVEFDEGIIGGRYTKSSTEDVTLNNSHTVIIKGLNVATTYHYRIVTKDKRNNETISNDYTFVTPAKEQSIWQLIVKSLQETFSWTKNVGNVFKRK